jgi:hypothetical protein
MSAEREHARRRAAIAVNAVFGIVCAVLLAGLLATGVGWLDAHVLPAWQMPRQRQVEIFHGLRAAAGAAVLILFFFARPRLVRAVGEGRTRQLLKASLLPALAVLAAFVTAEAVLRTQTWRAIYANDLAEEPLRQFDAELGWVYLPNHVGRAPFGDRNIEYAFDAAGYRVASPARQTEFHGPTVVIAGESVLLGWGLDWQDSVPAQLARRLGSRVVDISVNAYATDQIYMRLRRELPRFEQPVAVVTLFMPRLFDRNLKTDRPHLDRELRWHAASPPDFSLVETARRPLRYRSRESIDNGVAMTQAALRGIIEAAQARGAQAYIVVPQIGPAGELEDAIRRRVLDDAGIPYILVPLDPGWTISDERHPDARAAKRIAEEIARRMNLTAQRRDSAREE